MEDIRELRRKAESAVEGMTDGEMKLKAFEVVFKHLLESSGGAADAVRKTGVEPPVCKKTPPTSDVPRSVSERILSLQRDGFFSSQRSISEIQAELRKRGWHYALSALSGPLQILVQKRNLRREQLAQGNRKIWKYANY